MKVAIVVRRFSARGGVESNNLALARYLAGNGHGVTVVCQRDEVEPVPGVEVVPVPVVPVGETVKLISFSRASQAALQRVGASVSYTSSHAAGADVVRLENGLAADYRAALARGGARLRAALDPVEHAAELIERDKIGRAKRVLVLSDAAAHVVKARYPGADVRVVRNGIDLERFRPVTPELRAAARERFGAAGFVVAFVGGGFLRKGLGRLIDAMPGDATLLVAGRDRRARVYQARAKKRGLRARFLGHTGDVQAVLHASDVLALPSLYEPFGLAALEALAAGIPAAVSRAAGASEIVPRAGLIIEDPLDPAEIARAIHTKVPAAECRAAAERWPIAASLAALERELLDVSRVAS